MNKMKRFTWLLFFVFAIQLVGYSTSSDFQLQLEALPEVKSVQKIENHPFFKETFEVMIEQYLDHGHPQAGKFLQRVIISDFNKFSPVIFVTEGYAANYATKSNHINELCGIIEANQIIVEHRYFGKSIPENNNWDYLTIQNAASDLHRIFKIFQKIYINQNKWIATGISKGGQNTMAYYAYYPEDMNIWIPYVGPVNFGVEDGRMEEFIGKVGSPQCREKVKNFQLNVLKNRAAIQPLLDSMIQADGYTFFIPNDQVLDFCVLEYSFSFWQWGSSCTEIPSDTVAPRQMFDYLMKQSGPNYFAKEKVTEIKPFFVQTLKEFGYYGYDTSPFKPYLKIGTAENYIENIFLKDEPKFEYNKKTSKYISKAVQKNGHHMLLIYGELDPWTAGGITPKPSSKAVQIIKPGGSHRTRINNMTYAQQSEIYMLLETWLEQD